jgi:hypothetical protein
MTKIRNKFLTATFLLAVGGLQPAAAAIMTSSLGNTASGFGDGSTPAAFLVGGAQAGQPSPFDTGYGTDGLFGGNFAQTWSHTYAAIANPILSASITIGIYDHDSAASGSQLSLFDIDGTDYTTNLDSLFETAGDGADLMYNEYTLSLGAGTFAALADGTALITLNLMGPGLVTPLFPLPGPNPPTETTSNGANLIFSTLNIEYQDAPSAVPIPAALPLFASALFAIGVFRRRVLGGKA